MSVNTPNAIFSEGLYGLGFGRGDVERHVLATLRAWIVAYIADYERQQGIAARTLPIPPGPESIHGGIDFNTFSSEFFPEIIAVVQPTGAVERMDPGMYGQWYSVDVGAIVTVEGSQDATRALGDAYGTSLQKLIPQQGAFGLQADGVSMFATRTRLQNAYRLDFPDETVRDIIRATVSAMTFIENLVDDYSGPRTPPQDPYAVPGPPLEATKIEIALVRGTPDDSGLLPADAVILDGTVNPPTITYEEVTVDEPSDPIPDPDA